MKPLIGITGGIDWLIPDSGTKDNLHQAHILGDYYVKAIERAGGIAVILPVYEDSEAAREAVDRMDAILLSGGSDIDPVLFGERAGRKLGTVSPRRDAFDLAVARYVLQETNKPVLGICRGEQVMNVAMGGDLYVDLEESGKLAHRLHMFRFTEASHQVEIAPNTHLADIFGCGSIGVNSFHHQAIRETAAVFTAAARSIPDGVTEAIELRGNRFAVGLQWHPEFMQDNAAQQEVFRRFVNAARSTR